MRLEQLEAIAVIISSRNRQRAQREESWLMAGRTSMRRVNPGFQGSI
jgi:hypothetical protein